MLSTSKVVSWVVYKMTLHGKQAGVNAVCEQAEWDAIEIKTSIQVRLHDLANHPHGQLLISPCSLS